MLRQREDMEARLAKIRAKEKAQRDKYLKGDQPSKKRKTEAERTEDDEDQYVLDDYESDREKSGFKNRGDAPGFSAATLELMGKLGMGLSAQAEEEDEAEDEIKVSNSYCPFNSADISDLLLFSNALSAHSVHQ